MALTDFGLVRRSLRGRLFSTVTTVLSVGVAVGLLLVLLGMRGAAKEGFSRGTGNATVLVSRDASPLAAVLNGMFYANPPRAPIAWSEVQTLRTTRPWAWLVANQQGDSFRGFPVMATEAAFFTSFEPVAGSPWVFATGGPIGGGEDEGVFEAVLGSAVAAETGITVGDHIELNHGGPRQAGVEDHVHAEFEFEVVGVLEATRSPHDRAVFIDLASGWELHAQDRHERDPTTPDRVTDQDRQVTGLYGAVLARPGRDSSAALVVQLTSLSREGWTVAQPAAEVERLFKIVGDVDGILLGMAWAVMVSSGIGVMLSLYNSMQQRRTQIAVLRVLGASRRRVFLMVLTESAVLGLLGVAAGVAIALVGGRFAAAALAARAGLVIEPGLDFKTLIVVGWATVGLAMLAGLIPAIVAYRVSVVRSLRPGA
ncbi:MAG: putative ABC transport system permease protein [Phycisphaerales bacterium]|jgi:putative ABC transport system permease protein